LKLFVASYGLEVWKDVYSGDSYIGCVLVEANSEAEAIGLIHIKLKEQHPKNSHALVIAKEVPQELIDKYAIKKETVTP
jgi:hypothetical protein